MRYNQNHARPMVIYVNTQYFKAMLHHVLRMPILPESGFRHLGRQGPATRISPHCDIARAASHTSHSYTNTSQLLCDTHDHQRPCRPYQASGTGTR